ncbi:MAG TPA: TonB-dependent receptor [Flavobacteriales bacterium]|nr:TonB-dependent receptor [Flavobacteriales bacterium]HRE97728.1 TonB-dependent receptor [Flavobacteriales bacterium]HRJ35529.1 TonB-dependent receptor [Flavobacteriales bacterium]HRJ40118.1 TonB-dependent receptor [Flavobacteriales bacterium]
MVPEIILAQDFSVKGTLKDKSNGSPLPGANVVLIHRRDSSLIKGSTTDANGRFVITGLRRGGYRFQASFIGYSTLRKDTVMVFDDVNLGDLYLEPSSTELDDITVEERMVRVEIKGDTAEYNAKAFKVNPDATAEDLVKKMPGITSENGQMKVNGENLGRVLVNGRPFFGEDPNAALRNLPANMVDKIQVFDQQSDQAAFTGFNDGTGTRTINILTNQKIGDGNFGKWYAAYGTDDYYNAGFSLNYFKGARKLSFVGMSNNINQQNFSQEDLLGVNAANSSQGGGGSGGRGGPPQMAGMNWRGNQSGDFTNAAQSGIATTHSLGVNYSDRLGKKAFLSGSYFGNYSDRFQEKWTNRNFIQSSDSSNNYTETSQSDNLTWNHRVNLRLDVNIDSTSVLTWQPKGSFQSSVSDAVLNGSNTGAENLITTLMSNLNGSDMTAYVLGQTMTYRKRLKKKGRTISAEWTSNYNSRYGDGYLNSRNVYFYSTDSLEILDQINDQNSLNHTQSVNITYTEPIKEKGQLQITYNPSFNWNTSNKTTLNYDSLASDHIVMDTSLTSKFITNYFVQKGGLLYRFTKDNNFNFQVGANAQYATLTSDQSFPMAFAIDKAFFNILPTASAYYAFNKESNIRLNYRTSTNQPNSNQLQDVIDNTNPILLRGGNPDLAQSFTHSLFGRWMKSKIIEGTSLFWMMHASFTENYIGNSTFIATRDTVLRDNILLQRGSQYTSYANMSGNKSMRTYANYGFPMAPLKSNANVYASLGLNQTPGLVNGLKNISNNYSITGGFTLASNFSDKIDFTVTTNSTYSIVRNSLQTNSDNNYLIQNSTGKLNWIFGKGFVFATDVTHSMYRGLQQEFNRDFILWNAGLGYKFLKDRKLDVRLIAYDLLNQNNSINRQVTETYIEDTRSNVMNRYFQLQLTYTFRNFNQQKPEEKKP